MKTFNEYSTEELILLIHELHLKQKKSIRSIARDLKTYPLKLCRFCHKHQIPIMTASESLKSGYENGDIVNVRKGITLTEEEKLMIAEGQHQAWEKLSDAERMERSKKQQEIFAQRADKDTFHKKGSLAIRRAIEEGSKLEKHLIEVFKKNDIEFIHHYKNLFGRTNLEADFFLPEHNIVLEVDGPSHFTTIFGVDSYVKQLEADEKKNAIVLDMGASMIRIVHGRTLYKRDYALIVERLLPILDEINNELKVINVESL